MFPVLLTKYGMISEFGLLRKRATSFDNRDIEGHLRLSKTAPSPSLPLAFTAMAATMSRHA